MKGFDGQMHQLERATLLISAVVIAASFVATSREVALAVAAGAGLMSVNAWAIRKLTERATRNDERGPVQGQGLASRPGLVLLWFKLKMALLIALVLAAVLVLKLNGIGFLVGISVFPAAVMVTAVRAALADQPDDEQQPSQGER